MKIERFIGKKVNSFLNFDIKFNDDLTFVTGINGTGKTTALNCIVALLFPRFDFLASTQFEKLELRIVVDNTKYALHAEKREDRTILHCSKHIGEMLVIDEFEASEEMPTSRAWEFEKDYYHSILTKNSGNPVVEFIESLPSPMYLGLERRSLSLNESSRREYAHRNEYQIIRSRRKHHRNIFSKSISFSLEEAIWHAKFNFERNRRKALELEAKVRNELVIALTEFQPVTFISSTTPPTAKDLKSIETARKNFAALPDILNVPKAALDKNVDPLFQFLRKQYKIIHEDEHTKIPNPFGNVDVKIEDLAQVTKSIATMEWTFNKSNLDKINKISSLLSKYNKTKEEIYQKHNDYLETINNFLSDSAKKISFNEVGDLIFTMGTSKEERDIRTLSSGEIQLIVILTHLYFNSEVEHANVFIVDEPELSLHVQWQEKFVDSIIAASKQTQFIMATHSPSIILEKVSKCVEIK